MPSTIPGDVSVSEPLADAIPKSETWTLPSPSRRRFAGFTSRWTMPFACAWSSAAAACSSQVKASSLDTRPSRSRS